MDTFISVNVNVFESNENTKIEMFTDMTESLFHPSVMKKKNDFVQTHFMQHKFKLPRIHVMENRWRMTETPPSDYQLWDQSSSEYAVNTCSVNCFLAIQ